MKVATYNVNGINGRLPVLLRWLGKAEPDIVCLQELKAPQDKFPEKAIRDAGYEAVWHGQSRWNGVAILSRVGDIYETRRGLPGDPDDTQSRYIEAAVAGFWWLVFIYPTAIHALDPSSTSNCAGSSGFMITLPRSSISMRRWWSPGTST